MNAGRGAVLDGKLGVGEEVETGVNYLKEFVDFGLNVDGFIEGATVLVLNVGFICFIDEGLVDLKNGL